MATQTFPKVFLSSVDNSQKITYAYLTYFYMYEYYLRRIPRNVGQKHNLKHCMGVTIQSSEKFTFLSTIYECFIDFIYFTSLVK